jgi:hypothetical protein
MSRRRGPAMLATVLLGLAVLVAVGVGAFLAVSAISDEEPVNEPATPESRFQTRLADPTTGPSGRASGSGLTTSSPLTLHSLGRVRIGATVTTAQRAAGSTLETTGSDEVSCQQRTPSGGPKGVRFLFLDGRLAVILVVNPKIRTSRGVRIGHTVAQLRRAYGSDLRKAKIPGEWVIGSGGTRTIFATDGSKVTSMRTGLWRGRNRPVTWQDWCI